MAGLLPNPTGKFCVGCTDVVTKYGKDRCLFRLYYPSQSQCVDNSASNNTTAPLWLAEPEYADGFTSFLKIPYLTRPFRWLFARARLPVYWHSNPQFPKDGTKLPIMLFSHGLGGNRSTYNAICYEVASHGIFVAAIEHADASASATYFLKKSDINSSLNQKEWINFQHVQSNDPEEHNIRNKQVYKRANECSELLDHIEAINEGTFSFVNSTIDFSPFKGKLDLDKCAIMGHSFGGGTSITTVSRDSRFKAVVALDSWMYPLDKSIYCNVKSIPILFINSEKFQWATNVANMRKLDADTFDMQCERKMVTLKGTVHHSQCDFPLLLGSNFVSKLFGLVGTTDPVVAHEINYRLILGFVGKHLGLECHKNVEDILEEFKQYVELGSNVQIDEKKIIISKKSLRDISAGL